MNPASEKVKSFYNRNFFDASGKPVSGKLSIVFSDETGETVQMSGVVAMPGHSIDQVFRAWYEYIQAQGEAPQVASDPVAPSPAAAAKVKNVEVVEYRKNRYSVLEEADGTVVIKNLEKNVVIAEGPTHKAVLKRYREEFGG